LTFVKCPCSVFNAKCHYNLYFFNNNNNNNNHLEFRGSHSATSKLVHGRWWAVTFGTARRGLGAAAAPPGGQAPPRCTECNSPYPSTATVPITVLLYNGPCPCDFNVGIKGLTKRCIDRELVIDLFEIRGNSESWWSRHIAWCGMWSCSVRWCLTVGLASGDQRRRTGSGIAHKGVFAMMRYILICVYFTFTLILMK